MDTTKLFWRLMHKWREYDINKFKARLNNDTDNEKRFKAMSDAIQEAIDIFFECENENKEKGE